MEAFQPSLAAGKAHSGGASRALVLAGGGMRVAYQAGVLQALCEQGLTFRHFDASAGGTLTLAMLLSGLTPREMCRRWRMLSTGDFIALQPITRHFEHPGQVAPIDGYKLVEKLFPRLGIDSGRIRAATGLVGTFNACHYNSKCIASWEHTQMDLSHLLAAVSLPPFMEPVSIGGNLYTDATWIKSANLKEALKRGAEEIWLIWCIGNSTRYCSGTFSQFVHMLEISANGTLFEEFDLIDALNGKIARGESAYGQTKPIRLHVIRPDWPLPLEPELYRGHSSHAALVDQGYADAKRYLSNQPADGVALTPAATQMAAPATGVRFQETLRGVLIFAPEQAGSAGIHAGEAELKLHMAVEVRDLDAFLAGPRHEGDLYAHLDLAPFGLALTAKRGTFSLARASSWPEKRQLRYQLVFEHDGQDYCLLAIKEIGEHMSLELYHQATTVEVSLFRGADTLAQPLARGLLRTTLADLAMLLRSLHITNSERLADSAKLLGHFGSYLLGGLWAHYARLKDWKG